MRASTTFDKALFIEDAGARHKAAHHDFGSVRCPHCPKRYRMLHSGHPAIRRILSLAPAESKPEFS
jgi:hypothetical protein